MLLNIPFLSRYFLASLDEIKPPIPINRNMKAYIDNVTNSRGKFASGLIKSNTIEGISIIRLQQTDTTPFLYVLDSLVAAKQPGEQYFSPDSDVYHS